MKYWFTCSGHKNILAAHKTTLEFTKDKSLTKKGNCIIGINSDFKLNKIKKFLKFDKIKITIKVNNTKEQIICSTNKNFNDNKEIVIRLGSYKCKRTLGINANKASFHLNKNLIHLMKKPNSKMVVEIQNI